MSSELDLVLDRVPIEYPALVKEAVLAMQKTDISIHCASMNEKYCWFLSKTHMYIWERLKTSTRTSIPTQIPLPVSGLLQSTQCVVVYNRDSSTNIKKTSSPGILIVSPEGVLRHWPCIKYNKYFESILELNSEVVLKVELTDRAHNSRPANFFLTTTSGSIYILIGDEDVKSGKLIAHKLTDRGNNGIRRRLSSFMFSRLVNDNTSLISKSFLYGHSYFDKKVMILLSPQNLSTFDTYENTYFWNLTVKDFFLPVVKNFIDIDNQNATKIYARLIDAVQFRNGILVLMSATWEESRFISLYLVYISQDDDWMTPTECTWASRVPLPEESALFSKTDDQIYTTLQLCVSPKTAQSDTCGRSDGIIIVNPFFVQSMFVPDNLESSNNWNLTLCKSLNLSSNDQLLGTAIQKHYCYLMMVESGVSAIRLLPKGFHEGITSTVSGSQTTTPPTNDDWHVLSEILSEMVTHGLPSSAVLRSIHRAFELFGEKDMARSSNELMNISKIPDSEVARLFEQFLTAIIDYTDASNKTDTELHAKKVLTLRMNLFLKHMDLFDMISCAKLPMTTPSKLSKSEYRSGRSMLAEMNERVFAAEAIWKWRCLNNENAEAFDKILNGAKKFVPEAVEMGISNKEVFFGKLSLLHNMTRVALLVWKSNGGMCNEFFLSVLEFFMVIKDGILECRKNKNAISKSEGWWTMHTLASDYHDLCEIILGLLKDKALSESERRRYLKCLLSLYDFYLGEIDNQPDNDKVLLDAILHGCVSEGLALAEKHMDFGVLVKMALRSDKVTRQKTLNRLKKIFEKNDFEMYLCQYLKKVGMDDVLLEQQGDRVDSYLDNFVELRYSREIANKQYAKAAYTLMTLADNEVKSFRKFVNYLSRAYICAMAAESNEGDVDRVVEYYKKKLPLIKHRKALPKSILMAGFANDMDAMLSINEIIEWNVILHKNDEETVDGYMRALYLLSDLAKIEKSTELAKLIEKCWIDIIDLEEWENLKTRNDVETKSIFSKLCAAIMTCYEQREESEFGNWKPSDRLLIIPFNLNELLNNCQLPEHTQHKSWLKAHLKSVADKLKEYSVIPYVAYYDVTKLNSNEGSFTRTSLSRFQEIIERRNRFKTNVMCSDNMMES